MDWFRKASAAIDGHIEHFFSGPLWIFKLGITAFFLSIFFAFPSYGEIDLSSGRLFYLNIQIQDPLRFFREYPTNNNLLFRLTVPVIAKIFQMNIYGCFIFQAVLGAALFGVLGKVIYKICQDQLLTIYFVLSAAFIYAGCTSFVELRGMFDGVALFLLVLTMISPNPAVIFFSLSLSLWTDERAFVAGGFVLLFWFWNQGKSLNRQSILSITAVCVSLLLYWVVRLFLTYYYNLETEGESKLFNGNPFFFNQINNFPMGIWSGLEGFWILLVAAITKLRSHKIFSFLFISNLLASCFIALSVVDITRSMAYLFPSTLLSLSILFSTNEKTSDLRCLMKIVLWVSFFWPAYYAGGKSTIWWQYPLPFQLIRYISP